MQPQTDQESTCRWCTLSLVIKNLFICFMISQCFFVCLFLSRFGLDNSPTIFLFNFVPLTPSAVLTYIRPNLGLYAGEALSIPASDTDNTTPNENCMDSRLTLWNFINKTFCNSCLLDKFLPKYYKDNLEWSLSPICVIFKWSLFPFSEKSEL